MSTICLASCASAIQGHAAPALALFASDLWCESKVYGMSMFDRWCILSARHGLLEPERIIEPSDVTLGAMNRVDTRS